MAASRYPLGEIEDLRHFRSGETLRFGHVVIETISTPHDAEDGVVFVVDDGKRRLGVLTDLGHVFNGLGDVIASLDAVLLESNFDPDMLANCSYPQWLKERITVTARDCHQRLSRHGSISECRVERDRRAVAIKSHLGAEVYGKFQGC